MIENWLMNKGFDIDSISDEDWSDLENQAEELAQEVIDEEMDFIGEELVLRFKVKKKELEGGE